MAPENPPPPRPERRQVLLRLDPAVHEALAHWAADELRSVNAQVELDHTVFASTWRSKADAGKTVRYSDDIPAELKPYVPERVVGRSLPAGTTMVNGDILVPIDSVAAGQFEAYRVLPPNAPARDAVPLAEA